MENKPSLNKFNINILITSVSYIPANPPLQVHENEHPRTWIKMSTVTVVMIKFYKPWIYSFTVKEMKIKPFVYNTNVLITYQNEL